MYALPRFNGEYQGSLASQRNLSKSYSELTLEPPGTMTFGKEEFEKFPMLQYQHGNSSADWSQTYPDIETEATETYAVFPAAEGFGKTSVETKDIMAGSQEEGWPKPTRRCKSRTIRLSRSARVRQEDFDQDYETLIKTIMGSSEVKILEEEFSDTEMGPTLATGIGKVGTIDTIPNRAEDPEFISTADNKDASKITSAVKYKVSLVAKALQTEFSPLTIDGRNDEKDDDDKDVDDMGNAFTNDQDNLDAEATNSDKLKPRKKKKKVRSFRGGTSAQNVRRKETNKQQTREKRGALKAEYLETARAKAEDAVSEADLVAQVEEIQGAGLGKVDLAVQRDSAAAPEQAENPVVVMNLSSVQDDPVTSPKRTKNVSIPVVEKAH